MSLYQVSSGATINAADLNQLVQVLQQPSGGQEIGGYYLQAAGSNGDSMGAYVGSLSRVSTPVSVSIDTTRRSPLRCGSPSTDNLNVDGFHVFATLNTNTSNADVGGGYTIQF